MGAPEPACANAKTVIETEEKWRRAAVSDCAAVSSENPTLVGGMKLANETAHRVVAAAPAVVRRSRRGHFLSCDVYTSVPRVASHRVWHPARCG